MKNLLQRFLSFMMSGIILSNVAVAAATDNKNRIAASTPDMFHDQSTEYISTIEPDSNEKVDMTLRTIGGGAASANLEYTRNGSSWNIVSMKSIGDDATGYYDLWKATVPEQSSRYYYRFSAVFSGKKYYYGPLGISETAIPFEDCFMLIPSFKTPDWAKGILWYSILPDAFYNGDILNDFSNTSGKKTVAWGNSVEGLREYYGGDIAGISQKIDYIKGLGVDAVYLNPLWTSDSNAGYGPNNDYEISPNYGNEEDLINLCEKLHKNDMKIMLDAVFSYSQYNSIYVDRYGNNPIPGDAFSSDSIYSGILSLDQNGSYIEKWGGYEIDLGTSLAQNLFWKSNNSVLKRYLKSPYSIDGWRLDAVSAYAGTDVTISELAADIRENVKSVNDDALLVCEDYLYDQIVSGNWDATWNNFFLYTERLWFEGGEYDQSWLSERLSIMRKIPRSVGLCMYNQYDSHDYTRLASDTDKQRHLLKAVQMLLMTYVGSPCIYYGDETGMENKSDISVSQPRNCFNWNESEWDIETYNLYRSLIDLRKEYTALNNGAFKIGLTDDANKLSVMGRWDNNGSVVTMLNQQNQGITSVLDLKQYNIKDGSIVTDYLTGAQYTVQNGCVNVYIPSGGSILVTGKAGKYRQSLTVSDAGDYKLNNGGITVEGNGDLLYNGNTVFAEMPAFGCGYIQSEISLSQNGSAGLFLTDGNRYYSALKSNGNLTVYLTEDGKQSVCYRKEIDNSEPLRIGLTPNGEAVTYIATEGGGWSAVGGSYASFSDVGELRVGIVSLNGENIFGNLISGNEKRVLYDDFELSKIGKLFVKEVGGEWSINNGVLNGYSQNGAMILSDAVSYDFTFKAEISETNCEYSGVVSYSDENNAVVLLKNNSEYIFGVLRNNQIIPYKTGSISECENTVLQIQRVGSFYTAAYYTENVWHTIDCNIQANLSTSRAGIALFNGSAKVNYACFGDSIKDDCSYNTPITNEFNDTIDNIFEERKIASLSEKYEIISNATDWSYDNGGIFRSSNIGKDGMFVTNKKYKDFKIHCTLLNNSNSGIMGIDFLKSAPNPELQDGYRVSLSSNNTIELSHNGESVISKTVTVGEYGLKLTVIRNGDRLNIYYGQEGNLLISLSNISEADGYIGFIADGAAGHFTNYLIMSCDNRWLEPQCPYQVGFSAEDSGIKVVSDADVTLGINGVTGTDFAVSLGIELKPSNENNVAYAGLLLGASQGTIARNGGVLIALDSSSSIILKKGSELKRSIKLSQHTSTVWLCVIKRGNSYSVYVDGMNKALFVWNDTEYNGGSISLASSNSLGRFTAVNVKSVDGITDVSELTSPSCVITRGNTVIESSSNFVENKSVGNISYGIETFLDAEEEFTFECDFVVRNPASAACSPVIFFRGNSDKRIGLYINGNGTYLVKSDLSVISNSSAESSYRSFRRNAGKTYHVSIVSSDSKVTISVDSTVLYNNFDISNCLSGNFSGLPALYGIVCVQGNSETTVTTVKNISVSGVKREWETQNTEKYGETEPYYSDEYATLYSDNMQVLRNGVQTAQSSVYTEELNGSNPNYTFNTSLSATADYVYTAELCVDKRSVSWICPQLVICSGYINGVFKRISVTVRGDGIFILNEKTYTLAAGCADYTVKAGIAQKCRLTVERKNNLLYVWCDGKLCFDGIDIGEYASLPNTPALLFIMNNPSSSETSVCSVSNVYIWNRGAIDNENIIFGDSNIDGIIDVSDMVLAKRQKMLLNIFTEKEYAAADILLDGKLSGKDIESQRRVIHKKLWEEKQ